MTVLDVLREVVRLDCVLVADPPDLIVRPRAAALPSLEALEGIRKHKVWLIRRIEPGAIVCRWNLPRGSVPAGMAVLFLLYELERDAFTPTQRSQYAQVLADETRLGAPSWYAEIEAIESVLRVRRIEKQTHPPGALS